MAAVIAPVGKGMVLRSRAVNCSQNLRQIGMAAMMYAGDNQMRLHSQRTRGLPTHGG